MGIGDKISGRAKQAAGDLTGNKDLWRQGAEEERKGEAKQEAERARERAERKAREVESLEHATDPGALADARTKDELYERAQELDVPGRSEMTKDELAEEITRRQ